MARDEYDDRDRDRDDRDPDVPAAKRKVTPPAVALIVVGVLSFVLSAASAGWLLFAGAEGEKQLRKEEIGLRSDQKKLTGEDEFLVSPQAVGVAGLVPAGIQAVLSGLVVFGATRMLALRGRGWATTAAVLVMVPCSPGCVLGLGIGVWAWIALGDRNVKAAFAHQAPSRR